MSGDDLERADRNLAQGLLRMARATTPHELERRGVQRLHSIGMREVSRLIEAAVNRTLLARTLSTRSEELAPLVEEAGATLAELLSTHRELSASRGELAARRAELARELDELKRERADGREATVRRHDEERFAAAASEALRPLFKSRRAASLARLRVLEALRLARAEGADERDRRIELLERRVDKLVASLEAAERALQSVRALGAEDPGIASIYREVQGLEPGGGGSEPKREMLRKLFEANLELRGAAPSRAGAPPPESVPAP